MSVKVGKERRRSPRIRTRIECEVWIDGTEHRGRVLDVSDGGLSVTTEPEVGQGEPVRVVLRPPDMTAFEVSALAWHCRKVRQPSGKTMHVLGLMLSSAPEAYQNLLPRRPESTPEPEPPEASAPTPDPVEVAETLASYRIRVGQGARTRTLSLSATNADEARLLATENLGNDWDILEVRAR